MFKLRIVLDLVSFFSCSSSHFIHYSFVFNKKSFQCVGTMDCNSLSLLCWFSSFVFFFFFSFIFLCWRVRVLKLFAVCCFECSYAFILFNSFVGLKTSLSVSCFFCVSCSLQRVRFFSSQNAYTLVHNRILSKCFQEIARNESKSNVFRLQCIYHSTYETRLINLTTKMDFIGLITRDDACFLICAIGKSETTKWAPFELFWGVFYSRVFIHWIDCAGFFSIKLFDILQVFLIWDLYHEII